MSCWTSGSSGWRSARTDPAGAALVLAALVLASCSAEVDETPTVQEVRKEIQDGDAVLEIASGEVHVRGFDLAAGDFLRVLVDQQGVDVVLRLVGPDGEERDRVDSPNGRNGFEELPALAAEPGRYLLEIAALDGAPGPYRLAVDGPRPATADDRDLLAADGAYRAARAHFSAGDFEPAVDAYQAALSTFTRLDQPRRRIEILHGLCHARLASGELVLATALCDQAIELYRRHEDQRGLDVLLDRAGWILLTRGEPERALPLFDEALSRFEARGYAHGAALTMSHRATAWQVLGHPQRALDALEQAVAMIAATGEGESEAAVRIELGGLLLELQRHEDAREQFALALKLVEGRAEHSAGLKVTAARRGVAYAAARLGDLEGAEAAVAEALARGSRQPLLLMTVADVRERRGEAAGARRAYEEALDLARQAGDAQTEAATLTLLGRLATAGGDPSRGLRLCDDAREIFARVGATSSEAAARVRAAEALRDLGRLPEAWERLAPALDAIEELRGGTERSDFRTSFFTFYQDYYEIAIDVLMRLHDETRALAVHERRLARELRDQLEERRVLQARPEIPAELLAEERRLQGELSEASFLSRGAAGRAERIDDLVVRLQRVGAGIRRTLNAAAPAPAALSADELRGSHLDDETLLLVYALGTRRSYLWALSRQDVTAHELPPRGEIERLAVDFSGRTARSDHRSQEQARRRGRALGETLLGPVAPRLDAHARLVIVADGELQTLSFAALTRPGSDDYLVRGHEIVMIPSASALAALRRAHAAASVPPGRALAVFADPVYGGDDPRLLGGSPDAFDLDPDLRRSAEELQVDPLARLPYTGIEAEQIRDLTGGGDVFLALGFAASRRTLASAELRRYGRLHFAAHALVSSERPELSGLVLSLVDEEGRPSNGFVRSFEIAGLDLPAELVVLSACRTGVGKNVRGEGVQSLARAFLHAGAARVVFSLWEVGDRPTAELMIRFYEALIRNDLSPAAALRRAQIAMLDRPGSTPYQWAGFVLLGEWRREPHTPEEEP